jgi:hypothetical protein
VGATAGKLGAVRELLERDISILDYGRLSDYVL